jgi:chromosome segregation ATPase
MEKDKAKVIGVVGTASERAGNFVGKAATFGKRITDVATGSVSTGKGMTGLAKEDTKPVPEKKTRNSKATALKSDLVKAQKKLAETQKEAQQTQSQLESQIETLQERNNSLVSELEQAISEVKEITASDGAVRARVAALESELDAAQQQLEQVQSKADNTKGKKPVSTSTKAKLEAKLVATRRQMEEIQDKAKKTQSQFESQLEDMQAEKDSLLSELATARKDVNETDEITNRANTLAKQVANLESELASSQQELTETRNQAETTQSQLALQVEDLQAEKDSLISDLEKARNKANEIRSQQESANGLVAALEFELTKARSELQEVQNRAESIQTELTSQVEKLQLEKESLNSELQTAQSQVDEAIVRDNVMKTKTAALESEVIILRSGLVRARESESDNHAIQTEEQNGFSKVEEEVKEPATAPVDTEDVEFSKEVAAASKDNEMHERTEEQSAEMVVAARQISKLPLQEISSPQTEHKEKADIEQAVKEIESSTEVAAQEEQIDINVEEPELKSESQAQFEVAPAHSAEVTVEEVQAADFKNGAERILFSKAISDFVSQDATIRANAAAAIAGIHHELSPRLLIFHIADESSARVRQECIKALVALESKEGLSVIEQALADEAASVRLAAVWGLYRLSGTESIPLLTRMLSDEDASVRRRAVTCIGWLGGQISRAGNHSSHQVISALVQCLNDPVVTNAALDTLQTVTGKKMSAPRTSPERLIEQWQKWWKAELLGYR